MLYINIVLTCLTVIEFMNLIIRIIKLSIDDDPPELTDEMRARLYA